MSAQGFFQVKNVFTIVFSPSLSFKYKEKKRKKNNTQNVVYPWSFFPLQTKYGNITRKLPLKLQSNLCWTFRIKNSSISKVKNERLLQTTKSLSKHLYWFIHWLLLSFTEKRDQRDSQRNLDIWTVRGGFHIRNSLCSLVSLRSAFTQKKKKASVTGNLHWEFWQKFLYK